MPFEWFRTTPAKKQSFTQYSDDFYLSESGELILKDIPKDDQAVIDSYFSTRLEAILDQYSDVIAGMNGYAVEFSDEIVDIDHQKSDLDKILAVDELLDECRAKNPEYANLSREKLIAQLQKSYSDAVAAYKAKMNENNTDGGSNNAETEKIDEKGE